MNLKKIEGITTISIFIISFLIHFMYDFFPYTFVSFFCPVNESIWEHMKILYTSIIFGNVIKYFLLKINRIKYNNFSLSLFISCFSSIIIYLIIYLPIYNFMGENLIISIMLMLIVYGIISLISYNIMRYKDLNIWNSISIIFLIWGYVIFIILTYRPFHNYIFYDTLHNGYGIDIKK